MSYQHWLAQEAPVAESWVQLLPPSVVFQMPRSAPKLAAEASCMAAYSVKGAEGAMARLIRPTLVVGNPPPSFPKVNPSVALKIPLWVLSPKINPAAPYTMLEFDGSIATSVHVFGASTWKVFAPSV